MAGIGPATSPLPRECSTTEPHGQLIQTPQISQDAWSGRRGSNSRHLAWKASALPTELHPHCGLPNHLHTRLTNAYRLLIHFYNWWRRLDSNQRTLRERIYSPSPLTTRPPLPTEPAIMRLFCPSVKHKGWFFNEKMVPGIGIELMTFALQVRCSTN
jgi:hypothetical protein